MNQFMKWSVFNAFIYFCYTKPLIRLFGFLFVALIIFAGFFKIMYHGYNLSYEADRFYILVVSLACIIGNMKDGYSFKALITNADNIWGLKYYDKNINNDVSSSQIQPKKESTDKDIEECSIEEDSIWKNIKSSCHDYFYQSSTKDNIKKENLGAYRERNKEKYSDPFAKGIIISLVIFFILLLILELR